MEELGNQLNVLDKKNKCSYRETRNGSVRTIVRNIGVLVPGNYQQIPWTWVQANCYACSRYWGRLIPIMARETQKSRNKHVGNEFGVFLHNRHTQLTHLPPATNCCKESHAFPSAGEYMPLSVSFLSHEGGSSPILNVRLLYVEVGTLIIPIRMIE